MKREDLRAIEGLTDAQVDAIMALAGRDSTAAHAREDALQQQLTAAQQGLAAFGTQKPSDLATALQQVQQLQTQLNEQAADFRFRNFARNAAQDAGAIDAEDVINLLAQDAALKGENISIKCERGFTPFSHYFFTESEVRKCANIDTLPTTTAYLLKSYMRTESHRPALPGL